jgi:hypothetical protein
MREKGSTHRFISVVRLCILFVAMIAGDGIASDARENSTFVVTRDAAGETRAPESRSCEDQCFFAVFLVVPERRRDEGRGRRIMFAS